jgi:hypothetical protein
VRLKKWREEGLVAASYVYLLGSGHQVYFTPEQEEVLAKVALIRNGKLALLSEREAKNLLEVMKTRFSEEDDKVWLDELCADMGSAHRQAIIRAVEHGLVDNLALLQEALTIIANISSKSQLILTERLSSQSQATEDPPTLAHLASALGANEPANAAASANAGNVHPGGVQWFGESHGAASGRANAASEQWKQIKCQLGMEQNL